MKFWGMFLTLVFAFALCACSTGTVAAENEDSSSSEVNSSANKSSASKGKSSAAAKDETSSGSEAKSSNSAAKSSSSVVIDDVDENCEGEAGNAWDGTTAKNFTCGSGTKLSPYVIMTAEQLSHLAFVIGANDADYNGKYYKLGADILLNEGEVIDEKGALAADSTKLHKWTPIGNSSVAFSGNFDGNGHTVNGMFINTTSSHNGLFGNNSGTVANLTVVNSWVKGGKYTAGVVGLNDKGQLKALVNKASIIGTGDYVGGVVGSTQSSTSGKETLLISCKNYGFITGKNSVGGVAGLAYYAKIDSVENFGNVVGESYVGGILGNAGYDLVLSSYYINATNSKNFGSVEETKYVGGFIGACGANNCTSSSYSLTCGTLKDISNSGSISGKSYIGGIAGYVCRGEYNAIKNSGSVVGESYTAGLFGQTNYSTTSSLYNLGDVSGFRDVGGLIGYNYNATMADYYYLEQGKREPFGANNGGGVATPKSKSEMQSNDFAELLGEEFFYDSGINGGYPALIWEKE